MNNPEIGRKRVQTRPRVGCRIVLVCFLVILLLSLPGGSAWAGASGKKVLVVASYHDGYRWEDEIIRTLRQLLVGAELTVFHMDTKRNLAGARQKGAEAFRLYSHLEPDAVVTLDDNAQEYFVVPYLRDKTDTPVIFCGVNDDAG